MSSRHRDPGPASSDRLISRRALFGLAGGAAAGLATMLAAQPVLALAVPGPEDVALPPASYPALFHSTELVLGTPMQYFPHKVPALLRSLHQKQADSRLEGWVALLAALRYASPTVQLEEVNRFVNAVPYVGDERNWGVSDRWAGPAEFFAHGGDCEDFAIAKFVSLYRLGFNAERLRMVLAKDERKGIDHAFLAVYVDNRAYVLDNQIRRVTPHERITHYRPLCSFNDHRLWLHRTI